MHKGVGLALAVCVVWSTMAGAAVYRWVDGQGEVHYSDVPALGAQSIDTRTWKSPHAGHEKPAAPAQAQAEDQDGGVPPTRAGKCKLAKKQLNQYKSATKLVERDQFGAEHTLDDKARARVIKQARANVDKYCTGTVAGG